MDLEVKAKIEAWLKKNHFEPWHEGEDTWFMGQIPHMRFVDLREEPPKVGIKSAVSFDEEGHGCSDVDDIRKRIMFIYNVKKESIKKSDKKPVEQGPPKKDSVLNNPPMSSPPTGSDESHEVLLEFTCKGKGCKRKISKQDADASYFKYGKAMCFDCIKKEEESSKLKTNNCSDCGLELSMLRAEEQYRQKIPVSKFKCEGCEEKQLEKENEIKKEAQGKQKEPEKEEKPMTEPESKDAVICPDCGKELSQERIDQLTEFKIPIGEMDCAPCRKKKNQKSLLWIHYYIDAKNEKANLGTNNESKVKEKEVKTTEKPMTENKLAVIPEGNVGKPLTDAERENMINRAKAEKFLTKRGSSYTVQGKERPDSHMIQNVANEHNVSIEVLESTQDDKHCFVKVRAHSGEQYVDAVVNHDYEIEYQLKTMEIIKKNPQILDHWEGFTPVLIPDAVVPIYDKNGRVKDQETATYYLVHALLSFRKFSMRDARTKASAIASAMILNRDWRDPEELDSEKAEASLVNETMNKKI